MLTGVVEVDSIPDEQLRQRTVKEIESFTKCPLKITPFLMLHQELCLKRNLKVDANLLD